MIKSGKKRLTLRGQTKWRLYLNQSQIDAALAEKKAGRLMLFRCPIAKCLKDNFGHEASVTASGNVIMNGLRFMVCKLAERRIINSFDNNRRVLPQKFILYRL
jgi:hypothetical protein